MSKLYLYKPKQYWGFDIAKVEQKYNAKYVGDFCIKDKYGNWAESPCAIFWQEKPPVEGYSNYMALFVRNDQVFITSGESVEDLRMVGAVADNGEVIYSRFRHDYVTSSDGTAMIDGGRDYTKTTLRSRLVDVVLIGPDLVIEDVSFTNEETTEAAQTSVK
jgi:hypothetical protein